MLYVESDGTIRLTRGDTARLKVPINNLLTGEEYSVNANDVLKFSIKRTTNDTNVLVQKVVNGSNLFHIEPNDTKNLSFGKYVYDVELTTSDGDVYTVVIPTKFEVLQEVT